MDGAIPAQDRPGDPLAPIARGQQGIGIADGLQRPDHADFGDFAID
jgi:hypothetical protein